jgi:hypothetical protein
MARSRPIRHDRAHRALAAGFIALLGVVAVVGPVAAAQSWTIEANRSSVPLDTPATVTLTITNTSPDKGGGAGIGCVTVAIPTAYTVNAVDVASVSRGLVWTASVSAGNPRGIKAVADSNGDRLRGDPDDDVLVLEVNVTGKTEGTANWTTNELQNVDCSGSFRKPVTIAMSVVAVSTPTPKPTPPPTPKPTPTPTPTPEPTATSAGTPAPTPTATSGAPGPTPTPTLTPSEPPVSTSAPDPTRPPTGAGRTGAGDGPTGVGTPGPGDGAGSGGGPAGRTEPDSLDLGVHDPVSFKGLDLGGVASFDAFEWTVPGVVLTGPGLLLLALIAAQALGGLAWLPVVRRKIGSFGPARRGRPARRA